MRIFVKRIEMGLFTSFFFFFFLKERWSAYFSKRVNSSAPNSQTDRHARNNSSYIGFLANSLCGVIFKVQIYQPWICASKNKKTVWLEAPMHWRGKTNLPNFLQFNKILGLKGSYWHTPELFKGVSYLKTVWTCHLSSGRKGERKLFTQTTKSTVQMIIIRHWPTPRASVTPGVKVNQESLHFYQKYIYKPAGSSKSLLVKPVREVTATEVTV